MPSVIDTSSTESIGLRLAVLSDAAVQLPPTISDARSRMVISFNLHLSFSAIVMPQMIDKQCAIGL
jgi:hypothetical protein